MPSSIRATPNCSSNLIWLKPGYNLIGMLILYLSDQLIVIYLAVCSSTDVPGRHHLVGTVDITKFACPDYTVSIHRQVPVSLVECLLSLPHRCSEVLRLPGGGPFRMTCQRGWKRSQRCVMSATVLKTTQRLCLYLGKTQE